jgi:predicted Rossmann-fold nucleotide-binding protein
MSQGTASHPLHAEQVKIVRISDRQKELDRLPPPDTRRWVMRRKAQVVAAVRGGLLTFTEACERYRLSEEEFKSWMHLLDQHGLRGLRATRMQEYLPVDERTRATAE